MAIFVILVLRYYRRINMIMMIINDRYKTAEIKKLYARSNALA